MSNRITLAQLCKMDATEVASLSIVSLAHLQEDLAEQNDKLKAVSKKIADECHRRFSALAAMERAAESKMTGTVRVEVEGCEVKADLPKKVEWSQAELRKAVATLTEWQEDPAEYVKTEMSVAEKQYEAWPKRLKALFEPARTVSAGSPKYTIVVREAA